MKLGSNGRFRKQRCQLLARAVKRVADFGGVPRFLLDVLVHVLQLLEGSFQLHAGRPELAERRQQKLAQNK